MLTYTDILNNIVKCENSYIGFITDSEPDNKWLLMNIKDDLSNYGYTIDETTFIYDFELLKNYIKKNNKKTIIFVNIDSTLYFNRENNNLYCLDNSNCTIIFIINNNKNIINMIHIFNMLTFCISIIDKKISILKSRYGAGSDDDFDITKIIRKIKLKKLNRI